MEAGGQGVGQDDRGSQGGWWCRRQVGGGVAVHTLQLTLTGNINNRAEQTGWGYTCRQGSKRS